MDVLHVAVYVLKWYNIFCLFLTVNSQPQRRCPAESTSGK